MAKIQATSDGQAQAGQTAQGGIVPLLIGISNAALKPYLKAG